MNNSTTSLGNDKQRELTIEAYNYLKPFLQEITLYNYAALEDIENYSPPQVWINPNPFTNQPNRYEACTGPSEENFLDYVNNLSDSVKNDIINNPFVVIAGGAPRDWYIGNTCRDVDVYIYVHTKWMSFKDLEMRNSGKTFSFLEMLQKSNLPFTDYKEKTNSRMGNYGKQQIIGVIECEYKGLTLDLIFRSINRTSSRFDPTLGSVAFYNYEYIQKGKIIESIWETYDMNICEFAFDPNTNTIISSEEAEKGLVNQEIIIKLINTEAGAWIKHYNKIVEKFPTFVARFKTI